RLTRAERRIGAVSGLHDEVPYGRSGDVEPDVERARPQSVEAHLAVESRPDRLADGELDDPGVVRRLAGDRQLDDVADLRAHGALGWQRRPHDVRLQAAGVRG